MKLPLNTDTNSVPYIANQDSGGNLVIPIEQYILSAGLYVPVSLTKPLPTTAVGILENIFDGSFVFANSAAVGTVANVSIPLPSVLNKDSKYKITIINPSTVTSLSVVVENKETIDSTAYYPIVKALTVNADENADFVVEGLFGESSRLTISNYNLLGELDGFTGYVRIRRL